MLTNGDIKAVVITSGLPVDTSEEVTLLVRFDDETGTMYAAFHPQSVAYTDDFTEGVLTGLPMTSAVNFWDPNTVLLTTFGRIPVGDLIAQAVTEGVLCRLPAARWTELQDEAISPPWLAGVNVNGTTACPELLP